MWDEHNTEIAVDVFAEHDEFDAVLQVTNNQGLSYRQGSDSDMASLRFDSISSI